MYTDSGTTPSYNIKLFATLRCY